MAGKYNPLRRLFRSEPRAEVEDELAFHIEQRVRDYVARGMDPDAARAAALNRLGDVEAVRAECTTLLTRERRAEARRDWLKFSWLDFKLGFRMLRKYPGLTVVGGIAMAFAIAIGAAGYQTIRLMIFPELPLPGGDRIIAIVNWDASRNNEQRRVLYDFSIWREQLGSVQDLGAYLTVRRNLHTAAGEGEPVRVAEISSSAFRVTNVQPLLGRPLLASDEEPGAPPVVVIGYDVWRNRFGGDARVIGRSVRLGSTPATLVGVMPEGFQFPEAHSVWTPLRLDAATLEPGGGPRVRTFGRLAPGVTLARAEAEAAALGRRLAAQHPDTHEHLRPRVMGFAHSFIELPPLGTLARAGLYSVNLFFILFVVLICANVAALVFARTATRESEIVVRNALGASRGRIIAQLFAEALVLGVVALGIGLIAAQVGFRAFMAIAETSLLEEGLQLPFWFTGDLSTETVVYAILLTVIAAIVAGVLPGLRVTRNVGGRLRQVGAGGGGMRFGRGSTVAIVGQVAATIVFVAFTVYAVVRGSQVRSLDLGVPAGEYLAVRLEMDRMMAGGADATNADRERFHATVQELDRRLTAEPEVVAATFASPLPGAYHGRTPVQLDEPEGPASAELEHGVQTARVDPDFFETFGAPILSGRGFGPGDAESDRHVVIVNESFVKHVLRGRNPVGRRVRFLEDEDDDPWGPWHEIVGVVREIAMTNDPELDTAAGLYLPRRAGESAVYMAVRLRSEPLSFGPRLRALVHSVDPSLQLARVFPLDEISRTDVRLYNFWIRVMTLISSMALLLSLAAIYSVMAFNVSRRTREIGIRVALGADRRRIVWSTLARPFAHAALGVLIGVATMIAVAGGIRSARAALVVAAFTVIMMAVVMLAGVMPVRRALRIEPTEALRTEA